MAIQARNAALETARKLLRPIAGFMLRCGVSFREFSELAKTAFVAAATEDFGIRGRPTNISRVSLLTGIARKEVRRQRELLSDPEPKLPEKTSDATRVLSAWHQDPDFLDEAGNPAVLDGEAFSVLCKRYSTEVPASATLKELQRVGAIERDAAGNLRVCNRYYRPANSDPQWLLNAGSYVADLGTTINRNIDREDGEPSLFLGRAAEPYIDAEHVGDFHQFLEDRGQAFLEDIDAWLAEHQVENKSDGAVRLGVGVFSIQEEDR